MTPEHPHTRSALVDAHCHIDLLKNPGAAIERAESTRVHTIAVTNAPSVFFHTRDLCRGKNFVHAALGLHPELVATHGNELPKFRELISETRFVGEVGIDYVTADLAVRKQQRDIFASVVQVSSEAGGRIMTIHSRRAANDVVETFGSGNKNTGILHWFSGSRKELDKALSSGFFFSVNAAMLSSKNGESIVRAIPRDRVLTETDCPFARVEGRPSTPDDIEASVAKLASAWTMEPDEAAALVESNFLRILKSHGC